MQLAAYSRIHHVLIKHKVKLVVVLSGSAKFYSQILSQSLGFHVFFQAVSDERKQSHKAVGLKSSVWASLILPFRYHLKTFGYKAIWEALRVSLKNAKKGHGSSFQQGGTFAFLHENGQLKPTLAWREDYPGDWMALRDILQQGASIREEDDEILKNMDWCDVLDFVIQCRKNHETTKKKIKKDSEDNQESQTTNGDGCGESACNLSHLKKGLLANNNSNSNNKNINSKQ